MTSSVGMHLSAATTADIEKHKNLLLDTVHSHACAKHPLFQVLETASLSVNQCGALLRNYDAHAAVLRRLLLHAATIMPEKAVGYILENVRNEYGNGRPEHRHELQLTSLATAVGITDEQFAAYNIEPGVRRFISEATTHYKPTILSTEHYKPAIAAGAITATEIMALEEFRALQKAFAKHGLSNHIWFDHVNVEAEHTDESLALALYFISEHDAADAVHFGLNAILEANCHLYDGLAASIQNN